MPNHRRIEFNVDKNRMDLLQDGLEEIEELKRESESKNDSIIVAQKAEDEDGEPKSQPDRISHDRNPLSDEDLALQNEKDALVKLS